MAIKIAKEGKVKVYWSDKPENYSKDERSRIKKYFSQKYGVSSQNITIVYKPTTTNSKGEVIEIEGAVIENILSVNYQRQLFKEWLSRNNKDVDIDRLFSLDDKVNNSLDSEAETKGSKEYKVKKLELTNFLSFGQNNIFDMDKINGLTIVNSTPPNMGGKTTLTIDAVKFLFFGTTTKTTTNIEIFNTFTDKNEVIVKGYITLNDGSDLIIERNLKRTEKRKGGWNVTNKVTYYEILPDGEEIGLEEEDAIQTTKKIKEMVGTEEDFDLMVLATSKNLDDLIDSSSTKSGKLFTKFIGLEVLSFKEAIVRKMANEYFKTMKSNIYDSPTLLEEIENHTKNVTLLEEELVRLTESYKKVGKDKNILNDKKLNLASSKIKLNDRVESLNPEAIDSDIENITKIGKTLKEEKITNLNEIEKLGKFTFDEDLDFKLNKDNVSISNNIAILTNENKTLDKNIEDLIKGGICKSCNRKLDDVDNSEHIESHRKVIIENEAKLKTLTVSMNETLKSLEALKEDRLKSESRSKLELRNDRIDVELESLRLKIKEKLSDKKIYDDNLTAIKTNNDIDAKIQIVNTEIIVCETEEEKIRDKAQNAKIEISSNKKDVIRKNDIVLSISKESEVEKVFKVYIEMIGEKGISKLILRSVLPIINSEIQRLLEDVTDFDVEVFIDSKNKVKFSLIKNDIEKPLKSASGFELTMSSIALRCVLGKMSSLPTPNFISFDEVLGRVATENISTVKPLFDKISEMYDKVFFITQNDNLKDWGDNIITVVKEKNVSKIRLS